MNLRQPGFTYSACGPFKNTKKEYKNLYIKKVYLSKQNDNYIYLSKRTR